MYVFKLPSQMCVGVAEKQNLISAIYMTNKYRKDNTATTCVL